MDGEIQHGRKAMGFVCDKGEDTWSSGASCRLMLFVDAVGAFGWRGTEKEERTSIAKGRRFIPVADTVLL